MVPLCIVLMRAGVTTGFSLSYYGNSEYFPSQFTGTAFGFSNMVARIVTIFAPLSTEIIKEPIIFLPILVSIVTFTSCCL